MNLLRREDWLIKGFLIAEFGSLASVGMHVKKVFCQAVPASQVAPILKRREERGSQWLSSGGGEPSGNVKCKKIVVYVIKLILYSRTVKRAQTAKILLSVAYRHQTSHDGRLQDAKMTATVRSVRCAIAFLRFALLSPHRRVNWELQDKLKQHPRVNQTKTVAKISPAMCFLERVWIILTSRQLWQRRPVQACQRVKQVLNVPKDNTVTTSSTFAYQTSPCFLNQQVQLRVLVAHLTQTVKTMEISAITWPGYAYQCLQPRRQPLLGRPLSPVIPTPIARWPNSVISSLACVIEINLEVSSHTSIWSLHLVCVSLELWRMFLRIQVQCL